MKLVLYFFLGTVFGVFMTTVAYREGQTMENERDERIKEASR